MGILTHRVPPRLPAVRAVRVAAWALLAVAGCSGNVYGGVTDGDPDGGFRRSIDPSEPQRNQVDVPPCPGDRPHPLARDLEVRAVDLYQAVKLPLYQDGAWLEQRKLPVIARRQALLRVSVALQHDYEPRPLRAVLRMHSEAGGDVTLVDERTLHEDSLDDLLDSTFNVPIPAQHVQPDATLSVSLEELDCDAMRGDPGRARVPKQGNAPLRAESIGNMRVVLVPMSVDGREVKLDDEGIAHLTSGLRAFFPVPDVEVKVHAPVNAGTRPKNSPAWEAMLQDLCNVRQRDVAAADTYYLGLFQPAPTRQAYCKNGCSLGLAYQLTNPRSVSKCGVIAFFNDATSGESAAHELGHAHGLGHVACPTARNDAGIDENYPHPDGLTGDWGWDVRTRDLMSPERYDLMSYCNPYGMSGYHYAKLAERAREAHLTPLALRTDADAVSRTDHRELLLHDDGVARWSRADPVQPPEGVLEPASVHDAMGQEIAQIQIGVVRFSHTRGALLTLPRPAPAWATVVWAGRSVRLADVLPPR